MPQHGARLDEISKIFDENGIAIKKKKEMFFEPHELAELFAELPEILIENSKKESEKKAYVRFDLEGEDIGAKLYSLRSHMMSGSLRQSSPNDPQSMQFRDVCWWPANDADFKKFANFFRA